MNTTLIETHWNVKAIVTVLQCKPISTLIETHWNVKLAIQYLSLRLEADFNRNTLKCKWQIPFTQQAINIGL